MLAHLIAAEVIPTGGTPAPTPTPTPGPLTLALVKLQLHVTHDSEDDLLVQYMAAAADYVEQRTGKLLTRREATQEAGCLKDRMPLYWGPDPGTLVISYLDTDGAEAEIADARVLRGNVYPPIGGWPATADYSPIFLTYQAGYAEDAVPSALQSAQLLLIAHWHANREAVSDKSMAEVPIGVDALILPYRSPVI